jgi:hypothetical protein
MPAARVGRLMPIEDRITEVIDGYYRGDPMSGPDAVRWSPEPPERPEPAPFREGGLVRPPHHVDALRYAFVEVEREPSEWFLPRVGSGPRGRALVDHAVREWFGGPVGLNNINMVGGLWATAWARRARYAALSAGWATRDYPLRGAHKALSRPNPLRAGLTGRHGRRGR